MKKYYLITALFLFVFNTTYSQVGIGTITPTSTLDVVATNPTGVTTNVDGILIPRVTRERAQSMTAVPTSTMIYVTEVLTGTAAGTTLNVTSIGFYFFNGSIWEKISTGLNTNWSLTGNAGTVPGTNFLGTTTPTDLRIKTGNVDRWNISNTNGGQLQSYSLGTAASPIYSFQTDTDTGMFSSLADNLAFSTAGTQRMTIASTGNVGINIAPSAYKLDVNSTTGDAIFGHSSNVGGVLGYETNFVVGTAGTIQGAGVYANNPTAGYTSSYAQSTGAATVAANINFSDVWIASYNLVDNASGTFNPPGLYSQLNLTNATAPGAAFQNAIYAYCNRGTIAGNLAFTVGVNGLANSQNQDSFGVVGRAFSNTTTRSGGYFEANTYPGVNQAFAYVATSFGGINRKITGTNAVSEIVPTEKHGRITLTCPESPEYWYQDYGTVEMVKGKATIVLDEILADIIVVDDENPIRVICTPVGMPYFNGVTIMSQTKTSVDILELNGGNHSGKLQYQLVVRPKTGYGEGRFPQAPGPGYLKADKEPITAKAKNQPLDGRKIFYWPADHEVYKYNPEDIVAIGEVIPAGPNAGKIKLGNGKYGEGVPMEKPKITN
jgi:hypothetical protein